jgi:CBS domain-containing protein
MLNSQRFINAFNQIEKYLERAVRNPKWRRFKDLVDNAAFRDPVVAQFKDDLKEFADLRNAIVHERTDSHVIAEPNNQATEQIERIAALITDPPRIRELPKMETFTLSPDNPLKTAIKAMYEGAFSQIPIYEGKDFRGLLSVKSIFRWMGAWAQEDVINLQNVTVGEVLEQAEDRDNCRFLGPDNRLQEVVDLFQGQVLKGKRLYAILVTDSGLPTGRLLGILTIWDLPKILKKLE